MRITSGSAKGRRLKGPKGREIRPAAAKLRQSVFQILGDISGLSVLDLFAGTGSMGLEAMSRASGEAVFVDAGQEAVGLLVKNLATLGFQDRAFIVKKPVFGAIEFLHRKKKSFDLVFLDPPYDRGYVDRCLRKLAAFPLLAPGGRLICEHSPREIPAFLSGLKKVDERKYGQTLVSFFEGTS